VPKYIPTRIPINTLSGGVGRQAQSKRMPNEAQNLDNVFCTLERSVERRPGTEIVLSESGVNTLSDTIEYNSYRWFVVSENERFYIIIDRSVDANVDNALRIFRLNKEGVLHKVNDEDITVDSKALEYLKYTETDADLKYVAIGTSLLILNTDVKAGYTSDGVSRKLHNFDGAIGTEEDPTGYEVIYETASTVDPAGEAVVWTKYGTYIQGDTVIDGLDPNPEETTASRGIWRVNHSHSSTIGPINEPPHYKYRNDVNKGLIEDITEVVAGDVSGVAVGWTFFVQKGGVVPNSVMGEVVLEGDNPATADNHLNEIQDGVWIRCVDASSGTSMRWTINKWERVDDGQGNALYTSFVPVKDYVYPDSTKAHLGQSVTDLTKLKLPPEADDIVDRNNAEPMLAELYETIGNVNGKGKIYYFSTTYGTATPGYYRVKSVNKQPYLHKIRTPDKLSVIDGNRMPMQLDYDPDTGQWILRVVKWDPREGGTEESNPGPSPFRDEDGNAKQARISSMAFYRDRLFLSSGDSLFSSRLGNFDNFFIDDPANITSSDPIDLSVSSNKYSPIESMVPFNDYLFINSKGDTQFELIGSENQITPFTAEIAPTTFYSTVPGIEPQLLGNQIYFFDSTRLYIYFGQAQTNINQAIDVSLHCPGYLPENIGAVTSSPAYNSLFFVDKDDPSTVFTYVNRFSGDQVVQNSFFRHLFSGGVRIEDLEVFDSYLYMTVIMNGEYLYLIRLPLDTVTQDLSVPFIDNRYKLFNGVYDRDSNRTEYLIPFRFDGVDVAVDSEGVMHDAYSITVDDDDGIQTTVYVAGDTAELPGLQAGSKYSSVVELSEQFVRDDKNNVRNGVLNLRSISVRHSNTGQYDVSISRRGRDAELYNFVPLYVGVKDETFPYDNIEEDGEFLARVFGLSNETIVKIESDYPVPFNITNIEFRGKFNSRDSLLERR
jgi:hypothetical protein